MQGAVEFPLPSQSRSEGTGVVDAETSSGTYTPFASSQTAAPELEPPFPFDSCKGARPDGTHVNDELVQDGWCWWYRKYAPADPILESLEAEAREPKKSLWADPHPVPPWEWRRLKGRSSRSAKLKLEGSQGTQSREPIVHFVLNVSLNRLEEGCGNAFLNRVSQIQPEVNSKQGNSG